MVNGKKVLISMFAILMVMCFGIMRCYSQEKPPENIIKQHIISIDIIGNDDDAASFFRNYKFNKYNITNSLFSNINNRYCIIVDYDISYEELQENGSWQAKNKKQSNRRYSFEKKHNHWRIYDNWGPGEP